MFLFTLLVPPGHCAPASIALSMTTADPKGSSTTASSVFGSVGRREIKQNTPAFHPRDVSASSSLLYPFQVAPTGAMPGGSSGLALKAGTGVIGTGGLPVVTSASSSGGAFNGYPILASTQTTLPSDATVQTLTTGAFTNNQWITTTPPGSSSATVIPIIKPPGNSPPIALWNVVPGPPLGGDFPKPPSSKSMCQRFPALDFLVSALGDAHLQPTILPAISRIQAKTRTTRPHRARVPPILTRIALHSQRPMASRQQLPRQVRTPVPLPPS